MVTIIDAYNCLYAAGKLLGGGGPVSLRALCQWCGHAPGKIILVIDGVRKPHEPHADEFPNLHFVFPGTGAKADPMIARLVREFRDRNPTGRGLRVVSSDKAVLRQARGERAIAETAESFLRSLMPRVGTGKGNRKSRAEPLLVSEQQKVRAVAKPGFGNKVSPETRYWLEQFGFTEFDTPPESQQRLAAGVPQTSENALADRAGESVRPAKAKTIASRTQKAVLAQAVDLSSLNLDELLGPVKPLKVKKNRSAALPVHRTGSDNPS